MFTIVLTEIRIDYRTPKEEIISYIPYELWKQAETVTHEGGCIKLNILGKIRFRKEVLNTFSFNSTLEALEKLFDHASHVSIGGTPLYSFEVYTREEMITILSNEITELEKKLEEKKRSLEKYF